MYFKNREKFKFQKWLHHFLNHFQIISRQNISNIGLGDSCNNLHSILILTVFPLYLVIKSKVTLVESSMTQKKDRAIIAHIKIREIVIFGMDPNIHLITEMLTFSTYNNSMTMPGLQYIQIYHYTSSVCIPILFASDFHMKQDSASQGGKFVCH